jgi:hypothetical protein
MPATVYAFITCCKGDTMSVTKRQKALINAALAKGWYYENLNQHDRADAWFSLYYSLVELIG